MFSAIISLYFLSVIKPSSRNFFAILFFLNNNFYIVFPYKDLPLRKLYNRIILGVKVMKRTWNRWVRERLRICREIGTSEELFALRDILEVLLDLPI